MTRLNEIKARCEAATPGHWSWEQEGGDTVLETNAIGAYFGKIHSLAVLGADGTEGDAAFIAHAREDIPRLLAEVERLTAWVDDLHAGMYVNCVYCGHRYGPGETTPVSMADALKAHVEQCTKHPMSALKAEVACLTAERDAQGVAVGEV